MGNYSFQLCFLLPYRWAAFKVRMLPRFIRNLQQRYSTGLTQNRPIHKKRCRISPSPGRALADPHSKSAITEKLFDRTLFSARCIQQKHPGNVKHLAEAAHMSSTVGKEERRRVGERVVRRICGHGLLRGFHIKRKWHYPRTYCCADFSFYYGRNAADAHKKRVSSRSPSRRRRRARPRARPSFSPSSSTA